MFPLIGLCSEMKKRQRDSLGHRDVKTTMSTRMCSTEGQGFAVRWTDCELPKGGAYADPYKSP